MRPITIKIDKSEVNRVANAIRKTGLDARPIFAHGLNDAGKQANTALKRKLAEQTSLPAGRVARHMTIYHASRSNLSFSIKIRDRYTRITPGNYQAKQFKAGVKYRGWGKNRRRVLAEGTFILRANGGAVAMVREDGKIRPMFGASIARELERNKAENEQEINKVFNEKFVPRVLYALERSLKKANRKSMGQARTVAGSLSGVQTSGFRL